MHWVVLACLWFAVIWLQTILYFHYSKYYREIVSEMDPKLVNTRIPNEATMSGRTHYCNFADFATSQNISQLLSTVSVKWVAVVLIIALWRHQIETFSALLAICAGNSPVFGEFSRQRPVTRSFDVFFDLRLNKRLRKQSWGWWFETLLRPLGRHCN